MVVRQNPAMSETRSTKAEPQRRGGFGPVFFACWALFILFRCVIVIHRGYYRLGRHADGSMVVASRQPVEFYGSLAFIAAIAVIVLLWAIRRFRETE